MAGVEEGSFVGRAEQLAELLGLLEALSAGQGALVLLEGEPGIGKTRLAEEAARRATAAGAAVAWAACWDADAAPPFWPWTQLLRAIVADDPERLRAAEPGLEALTTPGTAAADSSRIRS